MPEIGYQADPGVVTWGTLLAWVGEKNPDMQWPNSIDVFDRMRREDPQVKSVLRAVTLPILRTEWVLDGSGCRDEVTEHIARDLGVGIKGKPYVAPRRRKGRFSFKQFLRLALLQLVYGHSIFEQVYTIDASGLAHVHKLAWRPPRTIADFEVAKDGGLIAVKQHGTAGAPDVRIPVDRLVAFVHEREGANWVGESLLRAAYKMFVLKDRVLRIQALTAERNGLGLPVVISAEPPESDDFDKAVEWLDEQIKNGEDIAKQARAGDAAGVSLPYGADLKFVGVTGKLPDTDQAIRYYDEQIARAVLANFLNLGGNNSKGSYALSDVLGSFFTDSLNTIAEDVADVIDQHVIEDIVDLNWGPEEPAPRLVPAPIGERQQITAEVLKALIECRALIVDEPLRAYVRDRWGLPVEALLAGETVDAAETEAEEAAA
ncbi:phage portal protein family protein [Microbacterium sp. IEGM 1404]|uniref:phage portal protein family protein n=1 Tax=Microbacterium sp. IEGM 1404 TaxID=3047084 RepID=UPI0024B72EBE|nr:hypothetical protein [Microbacterium sp. IEGM 1404]MDI9889965.1 hypothetical protein [Microbacterium sp. IEGM 1404]